MTPGTPSTPSTPQEIFEKYNFTIIEQKTVSNYVVSCNICQHHQIKSKYSVADGIGTTCINCIKNDIIKKYPNYTVSFNGDKTAIVKLKCNICGTYKNQNVSKILTDCSGCTENNLKKLISKSGFKYIKHTGFNYTVECNTCNTRSVRGLHDRKNSSKPITCTVCDELVKIKYIESNTPYKVLYIKGNSVTIKCKDCGEVKKSLFSTIKESPMYTCYSCDHANIPSKPKNNIFSISKFSKNTPLRGNKIKLTCNTCSTTKEVNSVDYYADKTGNYCEVCKLSDIRNSISELNFKYITHEASKYTLECNNCNEQHDYSLHYHISQGYIRCKSCQRYMSRHEQIIYDYIIQLGLVENEDFIFNYSNDSISELDFYFPKLQLAIEINGLAYHSTPNIFGVVSPKNKHFKKYSYCLDKNIFLLQITDTDVEDKIELIKSMISNKLKLSEHKIFARKCVIREVDTNESNEFLRKNHFQGSVNSKYKLGLYFNNILVSYISFTEKGELTRFASLVNHNVIGGFSRLLQNAIKMYKFKNITTFSDNMYSDGKLYANNGFIKLYDVAIGYTYLKLSNNKTRYLRYSFMKRRLKDRYEQGELEYYDEAQTEEYIALQNGYSKYYDAGKVKWEYKTL